MVANNLVIDVRKQNWLISLHLYKKMNVWNF